MRGRYDFFSWEAVNNFWYMLWFFLIYVVILLSCWNQLSGGTPKIILLHSSPCLPKLVLICVRKLIDALVVCIRLIGLLTWVLEANLHWIAEYSFLDNLLLRLNILWLSSGIYYMNLCQNVVYILMDREICTPCRSVMLSVSFLSIQLSWDCTWALLCALWIYQQLRCAVIIWTITIFIFIDVA